jgi:MFS family permease
MTAPATGLKFVFGRPAFRCVLSFTSLLTLALSVFFFTIALYILRAGVTPSAVGAVESVSAGALIAGAIIAPALTARFSLSKLGLAAAGLLAAGFAVCALTYQVWLICAVVFAVMLPVAAADAAATGFIIAVTPGHLQGRVGSASGFLTNLMTPIAPALGGLVMAWSGPPSQC